jgi:HAAS domain-containing protein
MKAELLDRYVREVGRRLAKKQRDDVQAELHSLLMDALQDRMAAQETGQETPSEEDQVAVLREFGPPDKVAAQYTPPHRYLIGPRFYALYRIVAAAVVGSMTLAYVVLVALAISGLSGPASTLGSALAHVFGDYVGAVLAGFGSVTLTFAVLERVFPEAEWAEKEAAWDPRALSKVEEGDQIEVGGQVVGIVLTVIALIAFNLFPRWIGASFASWGDWTVMPVLSDAFFTRYLPLINVSWIASIVLSLVLLRQGRWQQWTRVVDLVLTVFGAFILYRMAFGPSILTGQAMPVEELKEVFGSILPNLLKVGLIVGLLATVVDAVRKLYRIVRGEALVLRRIV